MYRNLEEIDFNCFFMANKNQLRDLVLGLNPYTQRYFKIKDLYVALSHQQNDYNVHIDMMVGKGGLELFKPIRDMAKKIGANSITWCTSENNFKVNKISIFYKAKVLTEVPNFYPDGSSGIIYQLDI